ncbi:hypothetical protein FWF74_03590 [Candidatus Saccharibacteria bacterium]|nr:hypothetical protein [Candidatus Saccharibacteria bacterium]MCL1962856.1 hypothetical protein [Candidatus Saccharibacteria bacterium]
MRKLQIGVIGSVSDLNYGKDAEKFAEELGKLIAKNDYVLIFGAEKDADSLPTVAAASAQRAGGLTIGVTYGKGLKIFNPSAASVVIATGLERGGGRETSLMLSCDGVIALAGGSGTLNEICVAYQANIPVVVVDKFGGWSAKLANEFLDERKRYKFEIAKMPDEALKKLINKI